MQTSFSLSLPEWLVAELDELPDELATLEDRMALVNRLADRNFREGNGGPFAAIVVDAATGRLVSVGVNVVLSSGISAAHAEVMALGLAQRATGGWDLGSTPGTTLQLVVNWRPCVMCYGASMWSGIRELVVAGSGAELERLTGFDEGPMRDDWAEQFEGRGIAVTQDVGREEALRVFRAYGEAGKLVYNARGGMTVA
jgi:tRNA(Arg) A34 adenosine deaminase TadA